MIVAAAKIVAAGAMADMLSLRAEVPVVVTAKMETVTENIAAVLEPPAMIVRGSVSAVPGAKSALTVVGLVAAQQGELEGIGTTAGEAATLAALT